MDKKEIKLMDEIFHRVSGEQFSKYRQRLGCTVEEVAEKSGVSVEDVIKFEAGKLNKILIEDYHRILAFNVKDKSDLEELSKEMEEGMTKIREKIAKLNLSFER